MGKWDIIFFVFIDFFFSYNICKCYEWKNGYDGKKNCLVLK